MPDALIYDHVRTPRGRGRPDGSLHEVSSVELAAQVLRALARRTSLDTARLDDVILGCAQPVGEQGGNIARAALLRAGYAQSVAGQQVHRFCASALEAVNAAAAQIMSGQSNAVIGGGVESMSRTVMGADGGAWSADPSVAYHNYFAPQGIGADLIATLEGFTRHDVDAFAVESQRRAAHAWEEGYFTSSVEPVRDVLGEVLLDHDEFMRPGTTLETLSKLKPSFTGLGQAGFDAVVLQRYRIRAFTSIGSEPTIMLTAPGPVTRKLLDRCGMSVSDIDLFEINEAFAAVVMRFMRELDLDPQRVNVNGGAIAMGHPLGATGAIILGTVLDELERRGLGTALVTLCAGNGLGTATIIERL